MHEFPGSQWLWTFQWLVLLAKDYLAIMVVMPHTDWAKELKISQPKFDTNHCLILSSVLSSPPESYRIDRFDIVSIRWQTDLLAIDHSRLRLIFQTIQPVERKRSSSNLYTEGGDQIIRAI